MMAPNKELTEKEHKLLVNAWYSLKTPPEVCVATVAPSTRYLGQIIDISSSIDRLTGTSSPDSAGTRTRQAEEMPWRMYIVHFCTFRETCFKYSN